jgi:hypothetical protein
MNTFRLLSLGIALGLLTGAASADHQRWRPDGPAATHAVVAPEAIRPAGQGTTGTLYAQANCNAVGQQVASQQGGQLASASIETRDGRQVCVVVILLPARDGERGRRSEVVVPL